MIGNMTYTSTTVNAASKGTVSSRRVELKMAMDIFQEFVTCQVSIKMFTPTCVPNPGVPPTDHSDHDSEVISG